MNTELCDDHHVCRNGGRCIPHPNYSGKFTCDCTVDGGDVVYAGLSCDHIATVYCNADNTPSAVSFCANGGICLGAMEDEAEVHDGCECLEGYRGDHCELTQGQSVPDYISPPTMRSNTASSETSKNKTLVASLSAVFAFLATAALITLFVVLKRKRNGTIHSVASPRSIREADSTQLDADGELLKDSVRATSGELYSPGSNLSQNSQRRNKLDTQVDVTEDVEVGEDDVDP